MGCLPHNVASIGFRCLKDLDCLATVLVGGGGGNGIKRSIPDGCGIGMCLGLLAGVIGGATGIGDTGGL